MSPRPRHGDLGRLCPPEENGAALVLPGWEAFGDLLQNNLRRRRDYDYDFQGCRLVDLARAARAMLLDEARRWTAAYRDASEALEGRGETILLAGHQPELVHPGVWFKTFALDRLARRHGAVGINLLVDNDVPKRTQVGVPGGDARRPELALVELDRAEPVVPYEERRIADAELFGSFGHRAGRQIGSLVPASMVAAFWPLAVEAGRRTDRLGASLAQARHVQEGRWGLTTLEVPLSRVCQGEPFAWFVAHLVAQRARFHAVYNDVVGQHRRANRIRSRAHPVPDLGVVDDWLEVPFWVWTIADPRRRPLWARQQGGQVVLSDRQAFNVELALSPEGQAERAVARLVDLAAEGVKIRPRTLTTTLWARLVLGDVFLHGIGGAKYDQVTDRLLDRFFGLAPLAFVTLSATLRLPVVGRPVVDVPRPEEIRHCLRRLTFQPERFLDLPEEKAAALAQEKSRWIGVPKTSPNASQRHAAIRRVNKALQPWVRRERERLMSLLRESEQAARVSAILDGREYPACLFPADMLRETLLGLLFS